MLRAKRWKPILTGDDATKADASVLEIAEALGDERWGPERLPFGLAGGSSGLAIFYHEIAQRWRGFGFENRSDLHWNAAIDRLAGVPMPRPNLYSGFTGVGWATAFLTAKQSRRLSVDECHEELEQELLGCLSRSSQLVDYDLINGPVGWGLYALERWPNPRAVRALEWIVDFLEERADRGPHGIRWHTALDLLPESHRASAPNGYYNLGLAHGIPGIWVLLAQTLVRKIRSGVSQQLLHESVRWGLSQRVPGPTGLSFPSSVTQEGPSPARTRLAWCYGDLGVAAALFAAGEVTGQELWRSEATSIARRAAGVRSDQGGAIDAGLCHGAAGIGHLFNRFYQATGEEPFEAAARGWLMAALAMREDGIGPGGYAARRTQPTLHWLASPGLLEGSAGVALALLAATGDREPSWDRFLSISQVPLESEDVAAGRARATELAGQDRGSTHGGNGMTNGIDE